MKITYVFILLFLFHFNINAQSDCPDAIIVCGDANYFDLEAEGIGQTPEISPDNACASGENNTIWLKIQINQGGTLGFVLTPIEDDLVIDFDFWLFGPIEECGVIGTAIRCSTTNPLQAGLDYITTGLNETELDVSEGPGPDGNAFVQWITVQDNEFYYLVIDRPHGFGNFSIEWTGTATFHAVPQFLNPNNIPLDMTQCDKDGVNDQSTPFDLTVYEDMFIGTQSPVEVTYHVSLNDATINENPIAAPQAYSNTSNPQTIYLRMTNIVTGCYSTETFTINITPPIIAGFPINLELCDDNKNGVRTFDLSINDTAVINNNAECVVTYHTSLQDARDGANAIGPLFENQSPTQTIWTRLENMDGCFSYNFRSFTISVLPLPVFNNPGNIPLDLNICENGQDDLTAVFNLTQYKNMLIADQLNVVLTYHKNIEDANAGENEIQSPAAYTNIASPETIYMRLANLETGCFDILPFDITVYDIKAGEPEDMIYCDLDGDGFNEFDLALNDNAIRNGNIDGDITYHKTFDDAESKQNPIGPLYQPATPYATETIWVRLEKITPVCVVYDIKPFIITVNPLPVFNNPGNITLDLNICENGEDDFTAVFNLTQYKDMLIDDQSNVILTYHEDSDEADAGENEIGSPTAYTNTASPQTIYMRLSNIETGCYDVLTFVITVYGIKAGEPENMVYCDLDDDGLNEFDLAINDNAIKNGTTDSTVTYYTSFDNAENRQNPIGPLYQPTALYATETIWVRLERITPVCIVYDIKSFTVSVKPLPVVNNPHNISFDLYKCDNDGIDNESTPFNLTTHLGIMMGAQNNVTITYYDNAIDAQNGEAPIIAPNNYTNTSNPQTIYIRLTNTVTGCFRVTNFHLNILPSPEAYNLPALEVCDDNNDGIAFFNLDPVILDIQNTIGNTIVTIHETQHDAIFGLNIITDTDSYQNNEFDTQTLYIRVESTLTHCFDITTLQLIVNPLPEAITPDSYILCDDGNNDLDGKAIFDLTIKAAEILGTLDPALYSISYYLTHANAETGSPVIGNPSNHLSASGSVFIKVTNNATGCYDIVELKLVVNLLPTAIQPTEAYTLCDVTASTTDGIEIFDLTSVIPAIILDQQGIDVTFHHTYADAQGNIGAITTPTAYPSGPTIETLFVRVTTETTGCYRIVLQDLKVEPLPIILKPTQDKLTVCDTNGEGIGEFNLEALITAMKNGEPDLEITFHHSLSDAQTGSVPIFNTSDYINATPYLEFLYVRVVNPKTGCSNTYQLELRVEPAPQAPALGPLTLCDEDTNNQDLKTFFKLDDQDAVIYAALNATPGSLIIHYFISEAAARAGSPRITTPAHYYGTDGQEIWVRVESVANNCFSVTSFLLNVNKPLALTTPTMLTVCNEALPNDAQAVFDLTLKDNEILGPLGIGQGYTVSYYEQNPRTNPLATPIATPQAYTNPPISQGGSPKTLYVVVTSEETCKSYTTLTIKVLPLPVPNFDPAPLELCDDNNSPDGIEEFNLKLAEADIRNNDNQSIITYHTSIEDAEDGVNAIPVPTAYSSASAKVWVRMEADTNNPTDAKCYQVIELELIVNPLPAIGDPITGVVKPYAICEAITDGKAEFDLNSHIEEILGANAATDYDIEFYLDQAALDAGTALPRMYTNVTPNSQTILVVVTHIQTGCKITKPLQLLVEESAIANPIVVTVTPLFECDDDGTNDGFHDFDLTVVEAEVLGAQNPATYKVTYHLSEADADSDDAPQGLNPITDPTAFLGTNQTIWVRVTNMGTVSKCHAITSFDIEVELLPEPVLQGGTICIDKLTDIPLSSHVLDTGLDATHSFVWYKDNVIIAGETGPTLVVTQPGKYSVIATSAKGCESDPITPVEIIQSSPAVKIGTGYYVSNAFSDNQTITVDVDGYGVYQYKLDEGPWQDSPVFTDVSPGTHTITVRDTKTDNPCEDLIIIGANIIDYPNFFTPNGDGFRDTWNIIGLDQADAKIYIFDRYGKLLKQISALGTGWDGTFNGEDLPATDYWFTVTYREIMRDTSVTKEFKAHFSLLR